MPLNVLIVGATSMVDRHRSHRSLPTIVMLTRCHTRQLRAD
jgi:hypothetical protein